MNFDDSVIEDEVSQIKKHLDLLSNQYQDSFLSKIKVFEVNSETELLQIVADQLVHEENAVRSLIDLAMVMVAKCEDMGITNQALENELENLKHQTQLETDFQRQVGIQYEKLYQDQLKKNNDLVTQLYETENKLDTLFFQIQQMNSQQSLLEQKRTTSEFELEQTYSEQLQKIKQQFEDKLQIQGQLCKQYRESLQQRIEQSEQLKQLVIQLEGEKLRKDLECKNLLKKLKERDTFSNIVKSAQSSEKKIHHKPTLSYRITSNKQDADSTNLSIQIDRSLSIHSNENVDAIYEITANLSQRFIRDTRKFAMTRISEEQGTENFESEYQDSGSVIIKNSSNKNIDQNEQETYKESIQDIFNKNGYRQSSEALRFSRQSGSECFVKNNSECSPTSRRNVFFKSITFDQSIKLIQTESKSTEQIISQTDLDNSLRIRTQVHKLLKQQENPYLNFFKLTTQCVKLNSSLFCEIISKDCQFLYQRVINEEIPFNQWYKYIKMELEK